jgi:hypothetical protein
MAESVVGMGLAQQTLARRQEQAMLTMLLFELEFSESRSIQASHPRPIHARKPCAVHS